MENADWIPCLLCSNPSTMQQVKLFTRVNNFQAVCNLSLFNISSKFTSLHLNLLFNLLTSAPAYSLVHLQSSFPCHELCMWCPSYSRPFWQPPLLKQKSQALSLSSLWLKGSFVLIMLHGSIYPQSVYWWYWFRLVLSLPQPLISSAWPVSCLEFRLKMYVSHLALEQQEDAVSSVPVNETLQAQGQAQPLPADFTVSVSSGSGPSSPMRNTELYITHYNTLKLRKIRLRVPLNFETNSKGVANVKEMVGILPFASD